MGNTKQITQQVTVGPQPTATELQELKQQGFQSVVNFRTDGEEEQPLSPQAEGETVQGLGMNYLHVPVSTESMEAAAVDRFRAQLADLPKPVFAHCKTGKRAGAMVMMDMALEQGMSGQQTVENAKQRGFECDKPELVDFVKNYVDSHAK